MDRYNNTCPFFIGVVTERMKPFKLKDPTAERHLVRLNPKQQLELVLSDIQPINVSGAFLKIVSTETTDKERVFVIEPTKDILEWSHLSTHFLGEVIIGTKTSLVVYLQDSTTVQERKNVVTVINPFNDSIRIRPFNVVEFIYCSDYDKKLIWTWELKEDIDIEEISYKKSYGGVIPKVVTNDLCYPHPRDIFQVDAAIHHFWFKLGRGLLTAMQEKPQKDLYIGRLAIEGSDKCDDYDDSYVDIYCDLHPKWRMKTIDFMTGNLTPVIVESRHRGERRLPKTMQVDFELIQTKSMYAGCKTIEVKVD